MLFLYYDTIYMIIAKKTHKSLFLRDKFFKYKSLPASNFGCEKIGAYEISNVRHARHGDGSGRANGDSYGLRD